MKLSGIGHKPGIFRLRSAWPVAIVLGQIQERSIMRMIVAAAMLAAFSGAAFAESTCKDQAAEKKLAGAALASFMKKCETDANAACDADSKAKKLAGAALDAHMKKCVSDKTGVAAAPSCKDQAAEKKLAGAALDSFVKKCEADAAAKK